VGDESLLSVKQVAALHGVCTRTVYETVDRREVHYFASEI